ncbi:hypothetical protein LAD12857_00680 [Lacrimispora amygdalina]|uniref:Uncharacterized protein n=1 Tax=Lacrimispora amygdalina TaxID=253257 RepID=A0ABQ5M0U0_9FIRM
MVMIGTLRSFFSGIRRDKINPVYNREWSCDIATGREELMNVFFYRLTICSMVINCLLAAAFGYMVR